MYEIGEPVRLQVCERPATWNIASALTPSQSALQGSSS